ncbi:ABC transporter ATP-binding protein [Catenulispora pinisilvae]|uniref:ABC transporter ATP-binding protein n=1 Tax=Catenulispora pinisilvae TaxID=2705253 RepID=UPI0018915825|nr:ABC transporter ATP-binding protein [Catenulispora pinisilvae]
MARWARLWRRMTKAFDVDAVAVTAVDDMAADPDGWEAGYIDTAGTKYRTVARRLPLLIVTSIRLAAEASKARTVALLVVQTASAVAGAFSLYATTDVLAPLFGAGATPDRIRAALPSMVLVLVLTASRSLCDSMAKAFAQQLGPMMDARATIRLQELCTRAELVAFDKADWVDASQRAERGSISARTMVMVTQQVLQSLATLVGVAGVLAVLHPVLVPLLLLSVVPRWWAAVRVARLDYKVFVRWVEGRRRQNLLIQMSTTTGSAAAVRALSLSGYLVERYRKLTNAYLTERLRLVRAETMSMVAGNAIAGFFTGVVYAVLALLLWRQAIPLAVGGTAYLAVSRVQQALLSLAMDINDLYAEGLYLEDYRSFCADAAGHLPPIGREAAPADFAEIVAEDVGFTYQGAAKPAVAGVSLRVRRGQVVAFVGENGAAKTTMAKLLARLYLPDTGRITWDGVDSAEMDVETLRSRIAFIDQDHTRFPFTAGENIRIGEWRAPPEPERVEQAAQRAGAHSFISALPRGYDTLLERSLTGGLSVSGGQWQRLALARGFFRRASLVIADEPTSSLDAAAEAAFYRQLREYGGTIVMITHRLGNVAECADYIYVFADGVVAEEGTHAELVAGDGWYAQAYRLQRQSFENGDRPGAAHAGSSSTSADGSAQASVPAGG